jgi:hypothetical protein
MDDAAWVIAERIGAAPTTAEPPTIPQLPAQRFQPDDDTPGLYLQCENREQRDAIMLALGWKPEPPPSLRTAAEEVLRYMDKIGFGDGSTGRSRVQKLLRYALAGEGG